jgi:hypothetical protein
VHQADVDASDAAVASSAARLLGARPAAKAAPAAAPEAARGDRTMALKSLKTPLAPVAGEPAPKPKGFFARLLGLFRR